MMARMMGQLEFFFIFQISNLCAVTVINDINNEVLCSGYFYLIQINFKEIMSILFCRLKFNESRLIMVSMKLI